MRGERVELSEPLANREGVLLSRGEASLERAQQGWLSGSRRKGAALAKHCGPSGRAPGRAGLPGRCVGAALVPCPRAAAGPGRPAPSRLAWTPGQGWGPRKGPSEACPPFFWRRNKEQGVARNTRPVKPRSDPPPLVGQVKQWPQQCLCSMLCKYSSSCGLSQLLWSPLSGSAQQSEGFLLDADLLSLLVEQLPQTRPWVSRQDSGKFHLKIAVLSLVTSVHTTAPRSACAAVLPQQSCSCLLLSSLANSLQQEQSQLCNHTTPSTMNSRCCSNLLGHFPPLCLGANAEYFNGSNLQGSLC